MASEHQKLLTALDRLEWRAERLLSSQMLRIAEVKNILTIIQGGKHLLQYAYKDCLWEASGICKEASERLMKLKKDPNYAGKHDIQKFKELTNP